MAAGDGGGPWPAGAPGYGGSGGDTADPPDRPGAGRPAYHRDRSPARAEAALGLLARGPAGARGA